MRKVLISSASILALSAGVASAQIDQQALGLGQNDVTILNSGPVSSSSFGSSGSANTTIANDIGTNVDQSGYGSQVSRTDLNSTGSFTDVIGSASNIINDVEADLISGELDQDQGVGSDITAGVNQRAVTRADGTSFLDSVFQASNSLNTADIEDASSVDQDAEFQQTAITAVTASTGSIVDTTAGSFNTANSISFSADDVGASVTQDVGSQQIARAFLTTPITVEGGGAAAQNIMNAVSFTGDSLVGPVTQTAVFSPASDDEPEQLAVARIEADLGVFGTVDTPVYAEAINRINRVSGEGDVGNITQTTNADQVARSIVSTPASGNDSDPDIDIEFVNALAYNFANTVDIGDDVEYGPIVQSGTFSGDQWATVVLRSDDDLEDINAHALNVLNSVQAGDDVKGGSDITQTSSSDQWATVRAQFEDDIQLRTGDSENRFIASNVMNDVLATDNIDFDGVTISQMADYQTEQDARVVVNLNGTDDCMTPTCEVEGGLFVASNVVNRVQASNHSGTPDIHQTAYTAQSATTTLNFGPSTVTDVTAQSSSVMNHIDLTYSP